MERTKRSRASRRALGATIAALAVIGVMAGPASAATEIGGQLFSTGGTVDVTVRPATAGFTSELFLQDENGNRTPIALNTQVGFQKTLGPFPAGQELIFGIRVLNTGDVFLMGPASRNPDKEFHAAVTDVPGVERTFDVGFEDLSGGGDRDYDDNV